MPTLDWNITTWEKTYDWQQGGEEWSAPWGSSEAQWFGCLLPRLHRFLPCDNVLEIGCGFGRWTKFLLPLAAGGYKGIDVAERCIAHCVERYGSNAASFIQNDGSSLDQAAGSQYDFVFSFDSLVHADILVLEDYIDQILALLSADGVCFIHHSNFGEIVPPGSEKVDHPGFLHCRDQSSTAGKVRDIIKASQGKVLIQELVNWGCDSLTDCFTLFARRTSRHAVAPVTIKNLNFMNEARNIRECFYRYCI